jgi:hypothetical protein
MSRRLEALPQAEQQSHIDEEADDHHEEPDYGNWWHELPLRHGDNRCDVEFRKLSFQSQQYSFFAGCHQLCDQFPDPVEPKTGSSGREKAACGR